MYGPVPDLLVGCGGLYAAGFLAAALAWGDALSGVLSVLLPLSMLLISLPHYGGTLARIYASRDQIGRYAVFTIYVTAALCVWFAIGTWNALAGSLMITLYLSWSPWHYSGQNYGIALMFLGRAGVKIDARAKRALWLSFVLSYLLTLLNLHAARGTAFYVRDVGESSLGLLPLGIPQSILMPLFTGVAVVYAGSLFVVGRALLRSHPPRALLPAAAIVGSQALWFVVPYAGIQWLGLGARSEANAFLQNALVWVAIAHAAQYLWITSYYARSSSGWRGFGHYFAKVFTFSSFAWTVPVLVFAPVALGGSTYDQGLALLLAALVNLHHFQLDGAIWKLRDGPIARVLIRSEAATTPGPAPIEPRRRRFGLHAVAATALACAALQLWSGIGGDIVLPWALERGHARVAAVVMDVGAWIGVGTPPQHVKLGRQLAKAGDDDGARRQFETAIGLSDSAARAHYELGRLLVDEGDVAEGIVHLREAVEIMPRFDAARRQLDYALRLQAELEREAKASNRS